MKIKPIIFSAGMAASFPSAMDAVVCRDEQSRLYRLRFVDERNNHSVIEELHRIMRVSRFAPEIIDGEIINMRAY